MGAAAFPSLLPSSLRVLLLLPSFFWVVLFSVLFLLLGGATVLRLLEVVLPSSF